MGSKDGDFNTAVPSEPISASSISCGMSVLKNLLHGKKISTTCGDELLGDRFGRNTCWREARLAFTNIPIAGFYQDVSN